MAQKSWVTDLTILRQGNSICNLLRSHRAEEEEGKAHVLTPSPTAYLSVKELPPSAWGFCCKERGDGEDGSRGRGGSGAGALPANSSSSSPRLCWYRSRASCSLPASSSYSQRGNTSFHIMPWFPSCPTWTPPSDHTPWPWQLKPLPGQLGGVACHGPSLM